MLLLVTASYVQGGSVDKSFHPLSPEHNAYALITLITLIWNPVRRRMARKVATAMALLENPLLARHPSGDEIVRNAEWGYFMREVPDSLCREKCRDGAEG